MMTQDEILAMLTKIIAENQQFTTWTVSTPHLVALVNQAVAREREECAGLCDRFANRMRDAEECADAIRARGETT